MVRISDSVEAGGRGSPSEVFSPNILEMEKNNMRKKSP